MLRTLYREKFSKSPAFQKSVQKLALLTAAIFWLSGCTNRLSLKGTGSAEKKTARIHSGQKKAPTTKPAAREMKGSVAIQRPENNEGVKVSPSNPQKDSQSQKTSSLSSAKSDSKDGDGPKVKSLSSATPHSSGKKGGAGMKSAPHLTPGSAGSIATAETVGKNPPDGVRDAESLRKNSHQTDSGTTDANDSSGDGQEGRSAEKVRENREKTAKEPEKEAIAAERTSSSERDKKEEAAGEKDLRDTFVFPHKERGFRWALWYYRSRRGSFTRIVMRRLGWYESKILRILREEKIPPELVMLPGNESSYLPRLRSHKWAIGMWQIMKQTALRYGLKITPWIDERRDVEKATRAMAKYLKDLYREFGQWELVAAAYNCGSKCVRRMLKYCPKLSFWKMLRYRRCRIPRETKIFVSRFFALAYYWRFPEKFRRPLLRYHPIDTVTFELPRTTDLEHFTRQTGISLPLLWMLNPVLSGWTTPPGEKFKLKLLPHHLPAAKAYFEKYKELTRSKVIPIPQKARSNPKAFARLAKKYCLSERELRYINRIWRFSQVKERKVLIVPKIKSHKRGCRYYKNRRIAGELFRVARLFARNYPPQWSFWSWRARFRARYRRLQKLLLSIPQPVNISLLWGEEEPPAEDR